MQERQLVVSTAPNAPGAGRRLPFRTLDAYGMETPIAGQSEKLRNCLSEA